MHFDQCLDRHVAEPLAIAGNDGPATHKLDNADLEALWQLAVAPRIGSCSLAHSFDSLQYMGRGLGDRVLYLQHRLPDADGEVVAGEPADRALLLAETVPEWVRVPPT